MTFLRNEKTARITMIVLLIVAILLGSHNSLMRLQSKATDVFYNGDSTGLSIQEKLNSIVEYSEILLKTAGKYYDDSNDTYAALRKAANGLRDAQSIPDKREALTGLLSAVSEMQVLMGSNSAVTAEDAKNFKSYSTSITSFHDQLSHSEYNEAAVAFNNKLRSFPASVLGPLTGVRALETF